MVGRLQLRHVIGAMGMARICACGVLATFPFSHAVALRNVLLAVGILAALAGARRLLAPPARRMLVLLVAWGVLGALSLSWAIDAKYSWQEWQTEILHCIVTFLLFCITTDRAAAGWLRAALLGATVLSFASVTNWALFESRSSTALHFNGIGMYTTFLVGALPFALVWAMDPALPRRTRFANGMLYAAMLMAGGLTLNRVFWLVAGIQALLVVLASRRDPPAISRWRTLAVPALLVATLSAALFVGVSAVRLQLMPGPAEDLPAAIGSDPRRVLWPHALELIAERPLTGAGFGRGAMRQRLRETFGSDQLWHAHNVILNHGLALGLPGVALVVAIFAAMIATAFRIPTGHDRATDRMRRAILYALIGLMAKNMFDDFYYRDGAMFLWALAGMAAGLASLQPFGKDGSARAGVA